MDIFDLAHEKESNMIGAILMAGYLGETTPVKLNEIFDYGFQFINWVAEKAKSALIWGTHVDANYICDNQIEGFIELALHTLVIEGKVKRHFVENKATQKFITSGNPKRK